MDFGAKGDGLTPDNEAFSEGLLTIASLGGGVLFGPPGRYLQTKPLVFLSGAGLQKVWKREWARSNQNSVLMLDIEKGYPGDETEFLSAALQMEESGSLRDMVLWLPQLKSHHILLFLE